MLAEVVQVDLNRVPVDLAAIDVARGHVHSRVLDVARPADSHYAVAVSLDSQASDTVVDGSEEVVRVQAVVVDTHGLHEVVLLVVAQALHLPVGAATRIDDASLN